MFRKIASFLIIFFGIVFFVGLFAVDKAAANGPKGQAANFTLTDLKAKPFSLSECRGKSPVLLFFWTTWCPHCRSEMKKLNASYKELSALGWEVIAINVGEPEYKVKRFIVDYNLAYRVFLDRDTDVADLYEIIGIPTYFLIDKEGQIILTAHRFPSEALKKAQ